MLNGWKTVFFNTVVTLVGVLEMAGITLPENFAEDFNGAVLATIGVVGILLRAITAQPVGWKK